MNEGTTVLRNTQSPSLSKAPNREDVDDFDSALLPLLFFSLRQFAIKFSRPSSSRFALSLLLDYQN